MNTQRKTNPLAHLAMSVAQLFTYKMNIPAALLRAVTESKPAPIGESHFFSTMHKILQNFQLSCDDIPLEMFVPFDKIGFNNLRILASGGSNSQRA